MSKVDILIPSVGESITNVTISKWLKQDGEVVKKGEDILSIDTDKASVEISADVSGMLKVLKQLGETVAVGSVVGTIDDSVKANDDVKTDTDQK